MKNFRILLVLVIVLISTGIIAGVIILVNNLNKGSVIMNIVPSSLSLSIDGSTAKAIQQGDSLRLPAGDHTLAFSQDGFQAEMLTINVQRGSTQTIDVALNPASESANASLTEAERLRGEGIAGILMEDASEKINQKYPLVNNLPIDRFLFVIYPGKSVLHPTDPTEVGIYIKAASPRGRQDALDNLRSRGYDPSDYEIIFTTEERR